MLVRFKAKTAKILPSRDPNWDPSKVETPKPVRRLKNFEQKRSYIAILEYREKARLGGPLIQTLEFKAEGGFSAAAQAAYAMANQVGKALAVDLHELRNEQLCRVIAVYEKNSFKDWEKENPTISKRQNKHIEKAVKMAKADKINPISFVSVKDVKTR